MLPLPDTVNWQVVIINIFAAIPGIILAVATLVKVIKTGRMVDETNQKTEIIKEEATAVKQRVENVEKIANGNNVLRAPRRRTDPPGVDIDEIKTGRKS